MQVEVRRLLPIGFVVLAGVAYVAVFVLLRPVIGERVVAFTVIPIVVLGWMYGLRFGALATIGFLLAVHTILQALSYREGIRVVEIPRILIGLGLAVATGWARDTTRRLRRLLDENRRIETALRASTQDLERAVAARTGELVGA